MIDCLEEPAPRVRNMKLSAQEVQQFYRIWWPLLRYVNARHRVRSDFPADPEKASISPEEAHELRNTLWASDELLETFIEENPGNLSASDLAIAASWRNRVEGKFFIFRHLKSYSIFLLDEEPPRAYGVLGLVSSIEDTVPWPLPVLVNAVLLPFEDRIIYDSLLMPYPVTFGSGIRSSLNEAYRTVRERGGVITTLQPQPVEELQQEVHKGNQRLLTAFRKYMAKTGLSIRKIEHHARTIEAFEETCLSARKPPRSLLDIHLDDLRQYLDKQGKNADPVSFKRLTRFLRDTGRIDWDRAEAMLDLLKQQ